MSATETEAPAYEFTIPGEPIGVNRMWRTGWHGGIYLTEEAEVYKQEVAKEARAAGAKTWGQFYHSRWRVEITYYHRYPKKRLDVDAPIKCIMDGLQGVLYENDWQVFGVASEVEQDANNPRVVVRVRERI